MSNMCQLEQIQTMMIAENQIEQIWANCRPIFGVGVGVFEMVGKIAPVVAGISFC